MTKIDYLPFLFSFVIAVFARLDWIEINYFYLFGHSAFKLVAYFVFLQIFLLLIRRRRRPSQFVNLDITRYGKYPGPAPISFPIINGWRLAVLARLQNSLIGDCLITPIIVQAMAKFRNFIPEIFPKNMIF